MKWQGIHTVDCCGGVCWWLVGRNSGMCFPHTAKSSARLSQAEAPWGAEGTSCQETSLYRAFAARIAFLATDLRLPPTSAYRPVLQSFFKLFPLQSPKYPQHLLEITSFEKFYLVWSPFSGSLTQAFYSWQKPSRGIKHQQRSSSTAGTNQLSHTPCNPVCAVSQCRGDLLLRGQGKDQQHFTFIS